MIAQLSEPGAQLAFTFGVSCLERIFCFRAFQAILDPSEIRIRRRRLFWPAITGEWFEICSRAISNRNAVCVRTVCIDIHVRLKQERFAMTLRMLQLQHGLAIVKIVSREKQIESGKILLKHFHFRLVKLRVKR